MTYFWTSASYHENVALVHIPAHPPDEIASARLLHGSKVRIDPANPHLRRLGTVAAEQAIVVFCRGQRGSREQNWLVSSKMLMPSS